MNIDLPEPFLTAANKIKSLGDHDRYLSAFIFGSVARKEQDNNSDLDVIIIINEDNRCKEINHPFINTVKLDITFRSLAQVEKLNQEIVDKGERVPMISESIIIFDKTGELTKLKQKFLKYKKKKALKKDYQMIQFMLYHADNKAKRNLKYDKASALLALDININDIIKYHYQIQGKWWLSNKRLLPDLRKWDSKMATLIEKFVMTANVNKKYKIWSAILNYVAKSIGERKEIQDINCNCINCKKDLKLLTSL